MSTNHRMSTIPGLRTSAASAMTQDGILAKRREYIALCAIAEQSAYLAKTLTATAQQQALMTDGGAALSKSMNNWLVIMRTIGMYAKDINLNDPLPDADQTTPDSKQEDDKRILLRVELNES
ncbi:hypothetical protein FRC20_008476 [Serendipita sp. 405]|nr:hypothetical protein FRC15_007526 [Serendipita sp. 397]KAG8798022.1 hypothetical protein FRC16_008184 [Serendipita sp. 398]KAG8829754.1 hypothetical protein FRC18_009054 [Serendipita sp. 400]KAG8830173.1 hypothetical protein FRC20_008476 [Serendipita sp. 405]